MNIRNATLKAVAAAAVLLASAIAAPAADPPAPPASDKPPATSDDAAPPVTWARKVTKDLKENRTGGIRMDKGGTTPSPASLFFVAPKTTGFTTRELPDVYWYISEASKQVTFTLLNGNKTEIRLSLKNVQPGFHKLDLAREAKAWKFKGLDVSDVNPANAGAAAPQVAKPYFMSLRSAEPKLLATAYIARIPPVAGQNPSDYAFQIKNELWYDAVDSLAAQLSTDAAKRPAPRRQFTQMLEAEEVFVSKVGPDAGEDAKRKARVEEGKVFQKLSVPDPIDLQSDTWSPKSVPDPIDLNSAPDSIDLNSVPDPIDLNSAKDEKAK